MPPPESLQPNQGPVQPAANFSVHFHVTWTHEPKFWHPMQIYADVKDHVVFVVDPPYEQRGGFSFFFLLSTVVFRLAMLQSLLYPALAICAPHRSTLDIWE